MSDFADVASSIAFTRLGTPGAPKLLALHGIGSLRQVWNPVLPALAEVFDVVAADSPGFGESPSIPSELPCDPASYALIFAAFMDRLGWTSAHLVGNSMGGWLALELAKLGRAESVTALAPAGLWRGGAPYNSRVPLIVSRRASTLAYKHLGLLRFAPVKYVALGALMGKPSRVPVEDAILHARGYADCPGFERVRHELAARRFTGGQSISVPISVEFAPRDPLIRRKQSDLSTLPPQTRFFAPPGWGHVPMYDDPAGVVELVRETSGV